MNNKRFKLYKVYYFDINKQEEQQEVLIYSDSEEKEILKQKAEEKVKAEIEIKDILFMPEKDEVRSLYSNLKR